MHNLYEYYIILVYMKFVFLKYNFYHKEKF